MAKNDDRTTGNAVLDNLLKEITSSQLRHPKIWELLMPKNRHGDSGRLEQAIKIAKRLSRGDSGNPLFRDSRMKGKGKISAADRIRAVMGSGRG